jgi:sulfur-oxidizing protein SoxX
MNRHVVVLLCSFLLIFLSACSEKSGPVRGFVLPQGDAEKGQQVFLDFKCYRCHEIPDVDLPERNFEPPFVVTLGGKVHRVKNYGELLTAVVYPDHGISPKYKRMLEEAGKEAGMTPMPYFGDEMTVTELNNLVEFLHGQYTRLMPTYYTGRTPIVL